MVVLEPPKLSHNPFPTRVIDFRYDIPFTEIPVLIEDGFEAQRGLPNGDVKVLAHFQAARDCLLRSLGEPICDVLLMIVLTFCSSVVTPSLPVNGCEFAVRRRKDPGSVSNSVPYFFTTTVIQYSTA
jgi:hypothetical protein